MPPKRKRAAESEEGATTTGSRTKKAARANTKADATKKASSSRAHAVVAPVPPAPGYSDDKLLGFFQKYADDEEQQAEENDGGGSGGGGGGGAKSTLMSIGGVQQMFQDAGLSAEGPAPFLLAWICSAAEFGQFSQDEFAKLKAYQIYTLGTLRSALTDLQNLFYASDFALPSDIPTPPPPDASARGASKSKQTQETPVCEREVYNLDPIRRLAQNKRKSFKELYLFCFSLMKKSESRVMEMEMATATWSVILQPKYSIMDSVLKFIEERPSYKAVNKDLWTMTLEFCTTLDERNLGDWNDDESWPSLIDEFVEWEKNRRAANGMDSQGDVEMSS